MRLHIIYIIIEYMHQVTKAISSKHVHLTLQSYRLTYRVFDGGAQFNLTYVVISVVPTNLYAPVFEPLEYAISSVEEEDSSITKTLLATVSLITIISWLSPVIEFTWLCFEAVSFNVSNLDSQRKLLVCSSVAGNPRRCTVLVSGTWCQC